MSDSLIEWRSFVDEALGIREPRAEKERRLKQLAQSIIESDLSPGDTADLLDRIHIDGWVKNA